MAHCAFGSRRPCHCRSFWLNVRLTLQLVRVEKDGKQLPAALPPIDGVEEDGKQLPAMLPPTDRVEKDGKKLPVKQPPNDSSRVSRCADFGSGYDDEPRSRVDRACYDGYDGMPGDNGKPGEPGEPGLNGWDGEPGEPGEPGWDGDPGPRGRRGPRGPRGPSGPRGLRGKTGRPGLNGNNGLPGPPGLCEACDEISGGSVLSGSSFSLKGDPGEKGPKGDRGPPGDRCCIKQECKRPTQRVQREENNGTKICELEDRNISLPLPCSAAKHKVLSNEQRMISVRQEKGQDPRQYNYRCDCDLDGWYRFADSIGGQMNDYCIPVGWRCGTAYAGWLSGFHPITVGRPVSREVKFAGGNSCDATDSKTIQILNCGDFYVYHLPPSPRNSVYCSRS